MKMLLSLVSHLHILLTITICSLVSVSSMLHAETFCVSDAMTLAEIIIRAQGNGEGDIVQLVQGRYVGNFAYTSPDPHSLSIEGGYTANCMSRVVSPANTVLDGITTGRVLSIEASQEADISIDAITIQGGSAAGNGGGLLVDTSGIFLMTHTTIDRNAANAGSMDGGGLSITANTVTMTDNTISNNTANDLGGGILVKAFTVTTEKNIIRHNISGSNGGGIYVGATTVNIVGNIIENNTSSNEGGGLYISDVSSNVDLSDNTITLNRSTNHGGGVSIETRTAQTVISKNVISLNTTDNSGGGIFFDNSKSCCDFGGTFTVRDNTIHGNFSNQSGAGIYAQDVPLATFTNNLIYNNTANNAGGAIALSNIIDIILTNNTLTGNMAQQGGGVFFNLKEDNSSANIYNNIIWNNIASQGSDLVMQNDGNDNNVPSPINLFNNNYNQTTAVVSLSFSIDPSNLDNADSLFVDTTVANYRLQQGSPMTNQGNNDASSLPSEDHDGAPRVINDVVDIGAFEFPGITAVAKIEFSPQIFDFGSVTVLSASFPQPFVISNIGQRTLLISPIQPSNPGEFPIVSDSCSGRSLSPGSSCNLEASFAPVTPGPHPATLSVVTNDPDTPIVGIVLSGNGAQTVGGSVTATSITTVMCENVTTGQSVAIQDTIISWDCEAAGLVINQGDIVRHVVEGMAD